MSPLNNKFSTVQAIRRADELYAARERVGNVRDSIPILASALAGDQDYGLDWRLSRAFFFLGQEAREPANARSFHHKGVQSGKRATTEQAEGVEGHFWLGVNLALSARLVARPFAIRHVLRAKHELKLAIELDASYHAAAPVRVMARLQHQLPRWLGGGPLRAREHYEWALRLAPRNTVTRIYLAELLLELGDNETAADQLESILLCPEDPDWIFEIQRDKSIAERMLTKLRS